MSGAWSALTYHFPKAASNTPHEYVAALRPESWTWLELLAAGVHLTSQQLATSLNVVFKEREYICELAAAWGTQRRGLKLSTFVERCTQSGYSQFVPTAIVSAGFSAGVTRHSRGAPSKRIRKHDEKLSIINNHAWRFKGHLEAEAGIRTRLATIAGSWASVQSQWRCWGAFMDEHHKWHAHFPVTPERLAAYVSFFDVASSGTKYVQALKKASSLLGVCWLEEGYVSELLRGSAKFSLPTQKSYFVGKYTGVITKELCQRGYISLARLCAVCYTFQLRAQSEAFGLEVGVKRLSNGGDDWHSEVILDGAKATIKLRRRKNTNYQTNLVRYCICKVWEPLCICGVCALRQAIRVMKAPHGKIFDGLRTTMISVIKDIAQDNGLGRATWHGF